MPGAGQAFVNTVLCACACACVCVKHKTGLRHLSKESPHLQGGFRVSGREKGGQHNILKNME